MAISWSVDVDDDGNSIWEADSPYNGEQSNFTWRIKQRLVNNAIEFYDASDQELRSYDEETFTSLRAAKAHIERAHRSIVEEFRLEHVAGETLSAGG